MTDTNRLRELRDEARAEYFKLARKNAPTAERGAAWRAFLRRKKRYDEATRKKGDHQ
jgi:hypothetical protein